MKFILAVLFICLSAKAQSADSLENKDLEPPQDSLVIFFLQEVLPAFGGFKQIFHQKPSFQISFNAEGLSLKNCAFSTQLKQLRPIKYDIADVELYDFQAHAEIGDKRFLMLKAECGEFSKDSQNFKVSLSIADESLEPSFYGLKVKTLDQEQMHLKLWSAAVNVSIRGEEKTMGLDSEGRVLPVGSFSEDSFKKIKIVQTINIEGLAKMSMPVSQGGNRVEEKMQMPLKGNIFVSSEGEYIPVLDISME